MGTIIEKITIWIVGLILGLDKLFAKWVKTDLEPILDKVVVFSLISSVVLTISAAICLMCEVDENIVIAIVASGAVIMVCWIIKMLFKNIKRIKSPLLKIVYVVLNLIAVGVIGVIVGYALQLVLTLIVLYFVFLFIIGMFTGGGDSGSDNTDHAGRKHVATLENGVKIYKGSDMMFNSYYKGSDGNYYEPDGNGFIRK